MPGGSPFGEDPGVGEQVACWLEPAGAACASYRDARYARELEAAQHQQDLATEAQAALQARQGFEDAQNQAGFNQALMGLALVGPVVLLVVGGIGGFLWWRRQRQEVPVAMSQLSDEELERLILERQIEAGISTP